MKRFLSTCLAAFAVAASLPAVPALAGPLPYVNAPMSTPQELVNSVVSSINNNFASAAGLVTASGTTTATATGLRIQVSVTGLTTAAGVTSASMVVTDTAVAANSVVFCQANGYAGAGNPAAVNVVPAAGTLTFAIQNTHASAALNATVPVSCTVSN